MKHTVISILFAFLLFIISIAHSYEIFYLPNQKGKTRVDEITFSAYAADRETIETNARAPKQQLTRIKKSNTNNSSAENKTATESSVNRLQSHGELLGEFQVFKNNTFKANYLNGTQQIFEFNDRKELNDRVKSIANEIFLSHGFRNKTFKVDNEASTIKPFKNQMMPLKHLKCRKNKYSLKRKKLRRKDNGIIKNVTEKVEDFRYGWDD